MIQVVVHINHFYSTMRRSKWNSSLKTLVCVRIQAMKIEKMSSTILQRVWLIAVCVLWKELRRQKMIFHKKTTKMPWLKLIRLIVMHSIVLKKMIFSLMRRNDWSNRSFQTLKTKWSRLEIMQLTFSQLLPISLTLHLKRCMSMFKRSLIYWNLTAMS